MLDRTKPPISNKLPKLKFPAFSTEYLSNGMKVYLIEDKFQPLINLKVIFPDGAAHEPIPGLAYIVSHLITSGTKTRNSNQISEEIDYLGAFLHATAHWDNSVISATALSTNYPKAIEILTDSLLNPKFDKHETDRLKKKHIAHIKETSVDPNFLVKFAFASVYYANHPYGHPRIGTEESINSIRQSDIRNWYKDSYLNSKPIIMAAGYFDKKELLKLLDKFFKKWNPIKTSEVLKTLDVYGNIEDKHQVVIINKDNASQTTLRIGKKSINQSHPDYPASGLANIIFGGYFQSRVNHLLREIRSCTYGAYSYVNPRKYSSTLIVETDVNENSTNQTVHDILNEMQKFCSKPVSKEEFTTAKQYLFGSFARKMETPQQISSFLLNIDLNGLDKDFYIQFFEKIANLKREELFEVQKKYFSPDSLVIAAAGNIKYLENSLNEFGLVKICNIKGNNRNI